MRWTKQIAALTAWGIRSIPQRLGPSLVTFVDIAIVVAVLVSMLAMGEGARFWSSRNTSADHAVILSRGAQSVASSLIPRDWVARIANAPGVKLGPDGRPLVSAGAMVRADAMTRANQLGTVFIVGVTNPRVHEQIHLVGGYRPRPGLHQLLVSRAAQKEFQGLGLGDHVPMRGSNWKITGEFGDTGGVYDDD
ncbi:MAG: hypothetical protein ACREUG_09505, partial [Steroidobacteraceae bacterium]